MKNAKKGFIQIKSWRQVQHAFPAFACRVELNMILVGYSYKGYTINSSENKKKSNNNTQKYILSFWVI